ncbi:RNA polymerase sigma factor [Lysobacter yangpyeongensis]|uniref:RNA polymerase sigma factor n=1 Tax=Lysobacter yangpyeongensis TaxID=346182 RepID=A0ABW0SHV7_9GAMM
MSSLQDEAMTDSAATPEGSAHDDARFEAFLREQRPVLVRFLARRTDEHDANDVAQEALVRLMRYRALPAEKLTLLMYRIALNALNDAGRRSQSRQSAAHVSLDEEFDSLPSPEPDHERRLDNQREVERVRAAILQLPPRCREVYLLNRIEGMSYSQIARHCGVSVKAVEKHIGRALQSLRRDLQQVPATTTDRT